MNNRSNINLVGNTTTAQNLGGGNEIYIGKNIGNNLQFRTISSTGTSIQIYQVGDKILISGATGITQTPQALATSSGTLTWNVANGYNARVTLSENVTTFTFSGAIAGDSGVLTVIQDVNGSRTMVLPSGHLAEGGSLTLSTAGGSKDILGWYYDGTNYFWNIGKAFA